MKQLTENVRAILALSTLYLTFAYFFMVTYNGIKPEPQIVIAIIGINTLSFGFFFTSSASGVKKDETISNMARNATSSTPPTELVLPDETIKVDITKKGKNV